MLKTCIHYTIIRRIVHIWFNLELKRLLLNTDCVLFSNAGTTSVFFFHLLPFQKADTREDTTTIG